MHWERMSERLRREHMLRDNWCVYKVSSDPEETPEGMIRVEGCEFPYYVRGERQGQIRMSKADRETRRVFFLPVEAMRGETRE